ncbi:MAG TPA: acyl-CoA dehydrogenase family protein [Acidimicrobiia bacterium]|nr:acyl-CoA dehydrogenase family protein [Acidimicrobiia bacterium]
MDFRDTPGEAAFRDEVRAWLAENLVGEFARIGGGRGTADEEHWDLRMEWERKLGAAGWIGLAWPKEYGGRGAGFAEQAIFNEEYARANAPGRITFFGEGLLGPTLVAYGSDAQKRRFLPGILKATELWCQGYSEPNAGSDLAAVQTRAVLDGDEWVINGQKVWTTFAHHADWCFVVTRTEPSAPPHAGISYILVPMDQPGVTVRPLRQMTGAGEFNEVFFDDARTPADMVVGEVNGGWKVAMATLGFERGTAFLALQLAFEREWEKVAEVARKNGAADDPVIRQRLARAYVGVKVMAYNGMRMQTQLAKTGVVGPEASIGKLYWSTWHKSLGELTMDILGPAGQIVAEAGDGRYVLDDLQRSYMFSRSETIYAGSSEIQKNIIGERVLGLPREPR